MILNNKGSSQLYLCLLLLLALSGITSITLNKVIHLKKNRLRINSLLCLRRSEYNLAQFISEINFLNKLILVAYPLKQSKIPYVSQGAYATIKITKIKQQYSLTKYYKSIYQSKKCSLITKALLIKKIPYKLSYNLFFKRDFSEMTKIKTKSYTIRYFSNEKFSLKIRPVIFKSTISIDNNLVEKISILTKEVSI